MKVILGSVIGFLGAAGAGLGVIASRYEEVLEKGAVVGVVPVGGLTREEAAKRLRVWWEAERNGAVSFSAKGLTKLPEPTEWDEAGLKVDDLASIAQVPVDTFVEAAAQAVGVHQVQTKRYPVVYAVDPAAGDRIAKFFLENYTSMRPARVMLVKGKIQRRYEEAGVGIDVERYGEALLGAWEAKSSIELPIIEAPKRIPDAELDRITGTMGAFATRFPSSNRNRSQNIKVAAEMLSGLVLAPGEEFSFNRTVGPRTLQRGFRMAGVYRNGRHDEGIGGGICQVSTTLYNAVLLSDLKVTARRNHSLSVAYVPLGRDAAVAYGALDFGFKNTANHPIAIHSVYTPGALRFEILGIKEPGKTITIERGPVRSKSRGQVIQHDPKLPFGKTVLVDKGGTSHRVSTWRVVKVNGKVVRREPLGESYYPGSPALYARNKTARAPAAKAPVAPMPATPTAPSPDI